MRRIACHLFLVENSAAILALHAYDKNELQDLSTEQIRLLKSMLQTELRAGR